MTKQGNANITTFRQEKLMPSEKLVGHLEGWIGEKMGQGEWIRHNGQFILTSERACFYREDPFEEVFETIPLSKYIGRNLVADGLPSGSVFTRRMTTSNSRPLSPKLSSTRFLRSSNAFVTNRPMTP